jgi:uncharacterized protein (DUF1015 family)
MLHEPTSDEVAVADISPFRGVRYNPAKAADLSKVVAPPYDVIDDAQRMKLMSRDEHNVVRLILPRDEGAKGRYECAAELLARWLDERVLVQDARAAIYVVRQEWRSGAARLRRTGFIAAMRLEQFGQGKIYPHENTLSAPKEDRLKLLRATRANLSQVFALFPDEKRDVDAWLQRTTAGPGHVEACDDAGVSAALWCETDKRRMNELTTLMQDRDVFIADGHHRYETALAYQRLCAESPHEFPSGRPQDAIMMLCVAMNNEGLVTLPTHRLLPAELVRRDELVERLKQNFHVHPVATFSRRPGELDRMLKSNPTANVMMLYVGNDRPLMSVTPRNTSTIFDHMVAGSADWRSLDVSILQYAVLEGILGITLERVTRGARIGYVHDADEAIRRVDGGEYAVAFILRPTPVDAVARVASHLEKMPPKSTFFYPKALTGLVIRLLYEPAANPPE